jgi:uncharacterized membrane protein YbhN (UPF0104 family)
MAEHSETPTKSRPRAIYWMVALALAGALLYFSLRGIEWLQVWTIVRRARLPFVATALGTVSLALFVRAMRWRVLLTAEGKVPVPLAFWATSAGYFGNNLLPARAGEVVRTLMVSRQSGMGKAFVLTTALSERVVDAVVLISISAVVLLTLPSRPGWLAHAARPFAVLGLSGVLAIALVPAFEPFWFRVLARLPLPSGLRHHGEEILRQGLRGIRSLHDGSRLSRFLLLTVVIWCLDVITALLSANAIGISISPQLAFLLLAGLGLGSALPSTPGYVGIYQFVAVSILTPFGISKNDAIAYILLLQATLYIVIMAWGLGSLGRQRKTASVTR